MDQKISDFQELAGQYAKQYGPHDWKKQAFAIDLFDTAKWLDKVRATKNDLEFYDVMTRYVSQLNDAHDAYSNPSNYYGFLGFSVDIYDGKLLVDSVDRTRLLASQYPIAIGYELVSIDGKDANSILTEMLPYNAAANDRSTRRLAAELVTGRYQWVTPMLTSIPEVSTVVFRRFDGKLETYKMRWYTSGVPLTSIGRFPGYTAAAAQPEPKKRNAASEPFADAADLIARVTNCRLPRDHAVVGFGSVSPIFARSMPGTFAIRLGRVSTDPFYSGTFKAGAYTIGYLRIPNFGPSDSTTALTLFAREIAFFQANTDGLILDIMRNPGGNTP